MQGQIRTDWRKDNRSFRMYKIFWIILYLLRNYVKLHHVVESEIWKNFNFEQIYIDLILISRLYCYIVSRYRRANVFKLKNRNPRQLDTLNLSKLIQSVLNFRYTKIFSKLKNDYKILPFLQISLKKKKEKMKVLKNKNSH